jgi:hypothetical protein
MKRRIMLGVFGSLMICSANAARSQRSPAQKVTAAIGTGYGVENNAAPASGPTRFARIGFAVMPTLVLGGELQRWSGDSNTPSGDKLNFSFVDALWYPFRTHGWFVTGALGRADLAIVESGSSPYSTGHSYSGGQNATAFGTGWDLRIAGRLFFAPSFSVSQTMGGTVVDHACTVSYSPSGSSTQTCTTNDASRAFSLNHLGFALGWR